MDAENVSVDYTPELAELLVFAARIGLATRQYSSYNRTANLASPEAAADVRWLSDALHDLDSIGHAVAESDAAALAFACERHIHAYRSALADNTRHGAANAFERAGRSMVDLPAAIATLERLKTKAEGQPANVALTY